eukprot:c53447_g1_i1.p2 GENE.c53447_g1_i1~~c53447_g1_i1.p2  ORF type:complete len:375 (+),score=77.34 c53447_g1_i1:85-1209(+)
MEPQPAPALPVRVLVVCVLMVLFGAADRISFKLSVDCVSNYVFFLNQLTMLVYVVAFGIPVLIEGSLTKVTLGLLKRYAVMGSLDGLCTLVVVLSAPYVAGPTQVIGMQGVIPCTMVLSFFVLKKRYAWSHVVGAVIILAGIVLSAVHSGESDAKHGSHMLWLLLFLSFNVFASISCVYKEHVFRTATTELSLNQVNFYVSVFQFFWTLAYAPVVAPLQGVSLKSLPGNFGDGAKCIFAHDNSGFSDRCAWFSTVTIALFFISTVSWNFLCLYLIKNASAAAMFITSTATIPLASLGFAVPFIVRRSCTPRALVTWEVLTSLIVVTFGLIIYNKTAERVVEEKPDRDDADLRRPLLINDSEGAPSEAGFSGYDM